MKKYTGNRFHQRNDCTKIIFELNQSGRAAEGRAEGECYACVYCCGSNECKSAFRRNRTFSERRSGVKRRFVRKETAMDVLYSNCIFIRCAGNFVRVFMAVQCVHKLCRHEVSRKSSEQNSSKTTTEKFTHVSNDL
jgi:hypothetical protein